MAGVLPYGLRHFLGQLAIFAGVTVAYEGSRALATGTRADALRHAQRRGRRRALSRDLRRARRPAAGRSTRPRPRSRSPTGRTSRASSRSRCRSCSGCTSGATQAWPLRAQHDGRARLHGPDRLHPVPDRAAADDARARLHRHPGHGGREPPAAASSCSRTPTPRCRACTPRPRSCIGSSPGTRVRDPVGRVLWALYPAPGGVLDRGHRQPLHPRRRSRGVALLGLAFRDRDRGGRRGCAACDRSSAETDRSSTRRGRTNLAGPTLRP